jgi:hypothetical protein
MANTRIGRTVSSAGSRRKATFSAWLKRTKLGESWVARFGGNYSQSNFFSIGFNSSDNCFIVGTSSAPRLECTAKFRDTNAWYHYVVAFDTEQSTASNRIKFYINGEQITSFGTATYPTLNQDLHFNNTGSENNAWLGGRGESTYEYSGIMSHVHWIDGTAYDASAFGSTDAVTGEWKINTSPNVTYGTNGYFMLKDGNSLTDASGNGNNFSLLVGTLTKTEDCPSNVFCTGNPLAIKNSPIFTNGDNTITALGSSPYDVTTLGTLGMSSGKFYYEVKWRYGGNQSNQAFTTGITASNQPLATNMSSGSYNNVWFNLNGGDLKKNNSDVGADYPISVNSIVGFAWDLDNGTLKIHENGTYKNSGNAVVTGIPSDTYLPFFSPNGGTTTSICDLNFGNGYFGTTAVSSAGTNASNNGIFEYDVPAGYTALSTKGLNL